jgi:hypothetical protein
MAAAPISYSDFVMVTLTLFFHVQASSWGGNALLLKIYDVIF